jgi:hypothetical protein
MERQWQVLKSISLDSLTHIEELEFQLETSDSSTRTALTRLLALPVGRVNHLEISHVTGMQQILVDLGSIFSKFFTSPSLTLSNISYPTFPSGPLAPHITRLKIDRASLSLVDVANALPQLEYADFDDVSFTVHRLGDVVWNKLHIMLISSCINVPWGSLKTEHNRPTIPWTGQRRSHQLYIPTCFPYLPGFTICAREEPLSPNRDERTSAPYPHG